MQSCHSQEKVKKKKIKVKKMLSTFYVGIMCKCSKNKETFVYMPGKKMDKVKSIPVKKKNEVDFSMTALLWQ